MNMLIQKTLRFFIFAALLFLTACGQNQVIVNNVDERQANEIVVFLASYGIPAEKMAKASTGAAAGASANLWNIAVAPEKATDAMAILNRVGLPRRQGTGLLDLFGETGLMTSDKQQTIRYQSGLESDLGNMIQQIDGVISATVKLSIPEEQGLGVTETNKPKPAAAVYVKHEGGLDSVNSNLTTKIKRLISSSVPELTFDNVTVVSDRSRFTDVTPRSSMGQSPDHPEMATIWSITMSEASIARFRVIFFLFCFLVLVFGLLAAWLTWKIYPFLPNGGMKRLFSLKPILNASANAEENASTEDQQSAPPENPGPETNPEG